MSVLPTGIAAPTGGYEISRSVRLRSSASAYFSRTPASAGSRTTWTWSGWIKFSKITGYQYIFGASSDNYANNFTLLQMNNAASTLTFYDYTSAYNFELIPSMVFRDPSAWYHIVLTYDSNNATSSDRVRMYVNGSRITAFSTATYPTSGKTTLLNSTVAHNHSTSSYPIDGYLTEVNFIDGQALTPSSFGETDAVTGVWKPKKYAGTYGTNGFYLNFSDNSAATAAAIGKDSSGNGNNWTPNNVSVTSGATYDSMTDVPTLTSATAANYCVMNPLFNNQTGINSSNTGTVTLTNANLTATPTSGSIAGAVGTIGVSSGKWYFEYTPTAVNGTGDFVGFIALFDGTQRWAGYRSSGVIYTNGSTTSGYATWTSGDVIGIALDIGGNTISCYKNNTLIATLSLTNAITDYCYPLVWFRNDAGAGSVNFGQRPFAYTPPTGFKALNTQNLPDATIKKGNAYFDATTYTGNATAGTIISNSGIMQPDLVWIKSRSSATYSHNLYDSVRGVSKLLNTALTDAESVYSGVTSFNSNGFTLGAGARANSNGTTFVAWQWKAGGSAVSNTNGSITSQVSANTTAGFSVVTYTGNGSAGATVGHGLGVAPRMMILKPRSSSGDDNWKVYHSSIGATGALLLNTTSATSTSGVYWNNTTPTSSVFTVGSSGSANYTNQNTIPYVAYCFAEVAGYSKFGSYTGNGSADGPFIFTGFRPAYVLIKGSSFVSDWIIQDAARNTFNTTNRRIWANLSNAETTSTYDIDFLSNGFKVRTTNPDTNTNGGTIIFAAFAENPFKNSLAR